MTAIANGVGSNPGEDGEPSRSDPVVAFLRVAEVAVANAREALDKALWRVQLQLHAWQTTRDPEARSWLDAARRSVKDGTAAARGSTREDILRAIVDFR